MNTLTTLHRLRQHLGFESGDTAEDSRLLLALQAATTLIERYAGRRFLPRYGTLLHTVNSDDTACLLLTDDVLTLTAITNGDGSPLDLNNTQLLAGNILKLLNGAALTWVTAPTNAIAVTGIWGWHEDWVRAWGASGDAVQDDPLSDNAMLITVNAVAGADHAGQTPRFQVGQLIRLEDEYVWVVEVNTLTNVLTVLRGVQGSPAVAHAQGTPLYVYQPPLDVVMLCLRVATWLYREPNTVNGANIPPMLRPMLDTLRRVRV